MPPKTWTSLEVASLLVDLITPLAVVIVGFVISRRLGHIEQLHWANQRVVERRIAFYFETVPQLNDLLCFFTFVGAWKEISPPDIVALKRRLDKQFFVHAPLFQPKVLSKYFVFINGCYQSFSGWGQDCRLKSTFVRRKESCNNWDERWESLFAVEQALQAEEVQALYNELVKEIAEALGVGINALTLPRGRVPGMSVSQTLDRIDGL